MVPVAFVCLDIFKKFQVKVRNQKVNDKIRRLHGNSMLATDILIEMTKLLVDYISLIRNAKLKFVLLLKAYYSINVWRF